MICDFWCSLYVIFCDFVIYVCDFFVISRKVYEKKISELPLAWGMADGRWQKTAAGTLRLYGNQAYGG